MIIEMLKPDKPDSATTLKGLDYIDVPGLSKREYRLNFFAHKEGTFSAKVGSKDLVSYEISLLLTSCSVALFVNYSLFLTGFPFCCVFHGNITIAEQRETTLQKEMWYQTSEIVPSQ